MALIFGQQLLLVRWRVQCEQTIAKIRSCQKNANAVRESSLKWNNATSFFLRLHKRRKSLLLRAFDHKKKETHTRLCIFFRQNGLMASWSVCHDCLKKLEWTLCLEPWSLLSCALQLSATACARVNLKMCFFFRAQPPQSLCLVRSIRVSTDYFSSRYDDTHRK